MALTKLNTHGIGADVILAEDIAANAVTVSEIQDNAVTLAKMASGTDGQIITYDASGDPVAVGPGTDGQVLTSTGAGSPPAFENAKQWTATTEGLVTTTSGQNNIDFTIPADVNQIKAVFYSLSQASAELVKIKVGNAAGTIKGAGYYGNTSTYWSHGSAPSLAENNDGIQLNGWSAAGNYWYGSLNMESVAMDGRRWSYFMAPYNDTYGEYFIMCNGRIALDSAEQIRKIRFLTDSGGFDAGGNIKVYTATF